METLDRKFRCLVHNAQVFLFLGMNHVMDVFILLGILFGSVAAVMAFLITYDEWQSHRFASPILRRKESVLSAVRAFFFFLALAILIGYASRLFL